jgi:hypothetical protein
LHHHADAHSYASAQESPSEIRRIARIAHESADKGPHGTSHVDAHVKNCVRSIFAVIIHGIKLSHERRYIGFKKTISRHHQPQTCEEKKKGKLGGRMIETATGEKHHLAYCHHDATHNDGTSVAPIPVGYITSQQRSKVYQT